MIRLLHVLALCLLGAAQAADHDGAALPATWRVGEQTLIRNGIGVREYGLFRIDGYVAALYTQQEQHDGDALIHAKAPRVLLMQYLHSGGARDDARKVWRHYLRVNCEALVCAWPQRTVAEFLAVVQAPRKGSTETFVFVDGTVDYTVDGTPRGHFDDPVFAVILLATWIGPVPSTQSMKRQLLGNP